MQVTDTIVGKARSAGKKGQARRLRASGVVPAVVYGPSSEAVYLALDPKTFVAQRMQYGRAHMYTLQADGVAPCKVFIKEVQRDAVSGNVLHVDLYQVDETRPIRVSVRVDLAGKPAGVVAGGLLSQTLHRIEVKALPSQIPDYLTVDVSHLDVGDVLHIKDIALPEGVKATGHPDEAVATVSEVAGGATEGEATEASA